MKFKLPVFFLILSTATTIYNQPPEQLTPPYFQAYSSQTVQVMLLDNKQGFDHSTTALRHQEPWR